MNRFWWRNVLIWGRSDTPTIGEQVVFWIGFIAVFATVLAA